MKSNIDCLINTTGLFYPQNVVFEMTLICHNKEIFKTLNQVDQMTHQIDDVTTDQLMTTPYSGILFSTEV